MIFRPYELGCLSQLSYLVGDQVSRQAVVVDPHRDVSVYLQDAAGHGLRIERVIETHCHADFLSGHLELAATGAVICYGQGVRPRLSGLAPGLRATPRSRSAWWSTNIPAIRAPYGVLTGDALFIGDVGRPDLLSASGLTPAAMAAQLYRSLWGKLLTPPDSTRVFPAHGAGSACGKNLSTNNSSTIGSGARTTRWHWAPRRRSSPR